MIMHVVRRAVQARRVSRVIVATDDERIRESVASFNCEAVMTSKSARSGTDRVAEAAASIDADIVVNLQGDEPLIEPSTIDAAIEPLIQNGAVDLATTSEPITSIEDVFSSNVVKVVTDDRGDALYFSRSPIPYIRTLPGESMEEALGRDSRLLSHFRKHSGLYVFRRRFLLEFARMETSALERIESLEQLRVLDNGYRIRVIKVNHRAIGVDTRQDYERVKSIIQESET